jgi:ribosomal protein S12 methylthiotransferase
MNQSNPGGATPRTFAFVTLGCPKNLVDSERMLGKLAQDGYSLTPDADGADVVVINTCGFIEPARQESLGVIREMLELKRQGRVGAVVVAGCLAERKGDDLLKEVPDVDHIVGVFGREEITQVVDRSLLKNRRDEQRSLFRPAPVRAQVAAHHAASLCLFEDIRRLR